jgi:hypothetical protein
MRLLAKYLGVEFSDSQYEKLVEVTSFKNMKASVKLPRLKIAQTMEIFRKGQIGDWKNYFTDEMSKKCDKLVAEKLKYKGKITYEPSVTADQNN